MHQAHGSDLPSGDPLDERRRSRGRRRALPENFDQYGVEVAATDRVPSDTQERPSDKADSSGDGHSVEEMFDELYAAADSLGVELTLQTAGSRLRRLLGPDRYTEVVADGGLRSVVESTGRYTVADDHGRHIVRRIDA